METSKLYKEAILDTMRELKAKRDEELLQQSLKEMDSKSKGHELPKNKVLNVKYLGVIKIGDQLKGIYLLSEQTEGKDGKLGKVERYYTEDGEFLAGNNNLDEYNFLLLNQEYMDKTEILEELEGMDKEGILDLNELEKERLEEIASILGIEVEDIERLSEIDPEEEVSESEKGEDETEQEKKEQNDGNETLSEDEVQKISTKTEIKTNEKVTDRDTISSLLKVQGEGYTKIAVVESDRIRENGNSTRFSFVGIKPDGSAEKINTLSQNRSYGSNPTRNIQAMNRDGSEVEEEKVNSVFDIEGQEEGKFAVRIGSMGTIETSYVRTARQDNGAAISIPIRSSRSIKPSTTREAREFMNRSRNISVKDDVEAAKRHEDLGCDDVTIRDIDYNPNNNTHEHIELSEEYLNECANRVLENDEIASIYNHDDIKARLREAIVQNENSQMSTEELINRVEEQMEKDAESEHEPRGPENRQ